MNNLVFNNTAEKLNATFFGVFGSEYKPVAVDEDGLFLFSPLSIITVTATDFDIRSLSYTLDSVTVTATNLDIRDLSGTQDSVAVSSMGFVEQSVTQTVSAGTTSLLTRDISPYSENSYFIRNTGGATITVTVQIAPVDDASFYINHTTPQTVATSSNAVAAVTVPMKFARLSVQASTNTGIVAYYNGRA